MAIPLRYPIATVSRLTGLPLDTIRAWERRYRAVVPERGPRGRVYTDAQVRRLRLLSALVEHGHAIGQVAALPTPRLEELLDKTTPAPTPLTERQAAPPHLAIAPVLEAVERFDAAGVNLEVARLSTLFAPRAFVYDVVLPLMRIVGERWHQGRLTIAQEHMVSAVVQGVMATLLRLHAAPQRSTTLLFASPEGEQHEFGLQAAAMLTAIAGLGVVYLGPNLPAGEIATAAADVAAAVVVAAVTGEAADTASRVAEIRGALDPRVELWVGGRNAADVTGNSRGRRRIVPLPSLEEFERSLTRLGGR
jgi:MerR family transcriptional regulator, light-induced transcriptional regulator